MKILFRVQHDAVAGFKVNFVLFLFLFHPFQFLSSDFFYGFSLVLFCSNCNNRLKTPSPKSERKSRILKCLEVSLLQTSSRLSKSQDKDGKKPLLVLSSGKNRLSYTSYSYHHSYMHSTLFICFDTLHCQTASILLFFFYLSFIEEIMELP